MVPAFSLWYCRLEKSCSVGDMGCVNEEVDLELQPGCITGLPKRKGRKFCLSSPIVRGCSELVQVPGVQTANGSSGLVRQPLKISFCAFRLCRVPHKWWRSETEGTVLVLHHGKNTSHCIFLRELQVSLKITKTNPSSGSQDTGEIWGSGEKDESFSSCRV